ncbi:hypothetical protein [Brevibacillus reuszeri]|uniref:hypothetical protein n=1 Tax=Brevibacillus reuszeri TaxID=54915 RepID=UPI002898F0CF|nr:hypothetical protein [Brevibacillus reuszeri]
MNAKSFVVTFFSLVATTGVLYFIGHWFTIPSLMFHHEFISSQNGFMMTTGSLLPLIVGLVVSFFAEKLYVRRTRQKLG